MAVTPTNPRLYLGRNLDAIETFRAAGGEACVYTHRAPNKQTDNEDSAGLIPCGETSCVIVVADGLGGLPAGSQASAKAVRLLHQAVAGHCRQETSLREAVLDGIEKANTEILALGVGAATTVAVVAIDAREVRAYHAGDSVILITGQRGKIKYQTVSHSPVGYAVEAGLVPEDDAIYHEDRHLISNMIGTPDMRVEIGPSMMLAARDTVVVASDGLFDNLQVEEVVEIVRAGPLPAAAETLAARCGTRMQQLSGAQPHKPDDLSFILFRKSLGSRTKDGGAD